MNYLEPAVIKKVRVLKARRKSYWYAYHIGETYEVTQFHDTNYPDEWQVVERNAKGQPYGSMLIIAKDDCEVIDG
jgi:ABC-type phosphate transport system auxiliary subunit